MNNKILIGALAILLLAGIVTAMDVYKSPYPYAGSSIYTDVYRTGPQRITDYDIRMQRDYKIDTYVYLNPIEEEKWTRGYPPFAPRATAEILSSRSRYTPTCQIHVSTKDLEPSYKNGGVYEAWLYDADTGYRFSFGVFKASMGGVGVVTYRGSHYLDQYDFVVITEEPYPDPDPLPGEPILMGEIKKPADYFRAWPKQDLDYGYEP